MKIAEVAPPWLTVPPAGYGGIELVTALLADGLAERGHDVTLFASGGSTTKATLVSPLPEAPGVESTSDSWYDLHHGLAAHIGAEQFDVVHSHTPLAAALGALLRGRPVTVHTLHGAWEPRWRRFYALVDRHVQLVAISEAQRAANRDLRYAAVIHNGIDLAAYPVGDTAKRENFLLFVGRSSPKKAPELAVEVAKRAGMRLKMVVKRVLPVEGEHWRREVEPRLRGDEEIYDDLGHDAKLELLTSASALVLPLQWEEPFGLAMIEAMACGTPVVAHPRGAAPEIVVDGTTGFLCDDVDAMVTAIAKLDRISPSACREHTARNFSAEAMVTRYERLFERLLGGES